MSTRRPSQSFASILEVATELFYRHGYTATSMQEIADGVQIHKSSLYHHTRSKEELLEAICRRSLDRLNRSLEEAVAAPVPGDRVTTAIRGAVRAALDDPQSTSIIVRLDGKGPVQDRVAEERRRYERRLTELVAAAQDAGEVHTDVEAALLTRLILGMINWIVQWFDADGPYSVQTIEEAVVALATRGLAGAEVRFADSHGHASIPAAEAPTRRSASAQN
jgi:AcrR family transcriptional regulator